MRRIAQKAKLLIAQQAPVLVAQKANRLIAYGFQTMPPLPTDYYFVVDYQGKYVLDYEGKYVYAKSE